MPGLLQELRLVCHLWIQIATSNCCFAISSDSYWIEEKTNKQTNNKLAPVPVYQILSNYLWDFKFEEKTDLS